MSASLYPQLPAEFRVSIARGVRVRRGGRQLIGGAPLRAMSLTAEGARVVGDWTTLGPVGGGPGRQALARRLLDAGMLEPHPDAGTAMGDLTFVVPVRDRPEQLERCLEALRSAAPSAPIIVVDDGSVAPVAVGAGHDDRVRVIRHATPRGPAAARNTGAAACTTALVGFADSDVVLPQNAARRLCGHFADPRLGAVAPRVRALDSAGRLAGYESRHSSLDMGSDSGPVGPGRPLSYVPSTVLFVRRSAVGDGFEESLRTGEDVDFVWRLHAAGWRVRHAADIDVLHEHPARFSQFVASRYAYACSIGSLARRHPDALPAVWVTPLAALAWTSALCRFKVGTAVVAVLTVAQTHRRLTGLTAAPPGLAAAVALRGFGHAGIALSRAVRRAWLPPLLVLARRRPRVRMVIAASFALRVAQDAFEDRNVRTAIGDAPLRCLDEAIAAAGTWRGCMRDRTLRPLLPSFKPPHNAAA